MRQQEFREEMQCHIDAVSLVYVEKSKKVLYIIYCHIDRSL